MGGAFVSAASQAGNPHAFRYFANIPWVSTHSHSHFPLFRPYDGGMVQVLSVWSPDSSLEDVFGECAR